MGRVPPGRGVERRSRGVARRSRGVARRSHGVAREGDVGYKASTLGVMAKCVFYMIGGWYVKPSTRDVMRDAFRCVQTHSNAPAELGFGKP